jgi:hypothetical protein
VIEFRRLEGWSWATIVSRIDLHDFRKSAQLIRISCRVKCGFDGLLSGEPLQEFASEKGQKNLLSPRDVPAISSKNSKVGETCGCDSFCEAAARLQRTLPHLRFHYVPTFDCESARLAFCHLKFDLDFVGILLNYFCAVEL